MRTIGVVTVGRSDYGIYVPVLRRIQSDPDLRLRLIVAGMHLSPDFGHTVELIEQDGLEVADRVEMLLSSDTPEGIAKSMGLGTIGFAQAYARSKPDILLVLGDRFEMHAAALAALPFKIPLAHIHGGELTEGAFDDALRHSITKLSHLHFVSTAKYGQRVVQMGEEPWRVTVCGAPSLDNLPGLRLPTGEELEAKFGLRLQPRPILVTFHPVTLEYEQTEWQIEELLAALESSGFPLVFTMPNADTNGRLVARRLEQYVQSHSSAWMINNMGIDNYFGMMACAAAMLGNSSSGIIEAPSFGLPVVNIGTRQQGRVRGANVIDVGYGREEIIKGIKAATEPRFREQAKVQPNPYGDGQASGKIVDTLRNVTIDQRLVMKRFWEPVNPPDLTPDYSKVAS